MVPPRRRHNTLAQIKVTGREGADNWLPIMVHCIEMPDGRQWDAVNGWREVDPEITEREEYIAVLEAEIAALKANAKRPR